MPIGFENMETAGHLRKNSMVWEEARGTLFRLKILLVWPMQSHKIDITQKYAGPVTEISVFTNLSSYFPLSNCLWGQISTHPVAYSAKEPE